MKYVFLECQKPLFRVQKCLGDGLFCTLKSTIPFGWKEYVVVLQRNITFELYRDNFVNIHLKLAYYIYFYGADIEVPKINCPDDIETATLEHQNSANISWEVPSATDNSGEEVSKIHILM